MAFHAAAMRTAATRWTLGITGLLEQWRQQTLRVFKSKKVSCTRICILETPQRCTPASTAASHVVQNAGLP